MNMEVQKEWDEFYRLLAEMNGKVQEITMDEKRGHWGTEAELALVELEDAIGNCMEQTQFIRERLGGRTR